MPAVDVINTFVNRNERPAWVRFEIVAQENQAETLKQGKWVGTDVDYVFITPAYTKDEVVKKVSAWKEQLRLQVIQGRTSQQQADRYLAEYEAWKKGQELPPDGTPIKGWGMISPAQQQVLLSVRIRTVEDLAAINDDGIRMVGMGSVDMKQKAIAWLAQNNDKGPLTVKMSAIEAENRAKSIEIDTLKEQVKQLMAAVQRDAYTMKQTSPDNGPLSAAAILEESPSLPVPVAVAPAPSQEPPPAVKRHRRTKAEMEAARSGQTPAQPPPTYEDI